MTLTPWDVISWAFAALVVSVVVLFIVAMVGMIIEEARKK